MSLFLLQLLPRDFALSQDSILIERLELTAVQGTLSPHKEVRTGADSRRGRDRRPCRLLKAERCGALACPRPSRKHFLSVYVLGSMVAEPGEGVATPFRSSESTALNYRLASSCPKPLHAYRMLALGLDLLVLALRAPLRAPYFSDNLESLSLRSKWSRDIRILFRILFLSNLYTQGGA